MYIIAEIGINHNGDLKLAKRLIRKAKKASCNAVKFQKRTVDLVYSKEELDTPRTSPFGTTAREQKEGIELSILEYKELESYSKKLGLDFIVSCWDLDSLDNVENNVNVRYHKVASAMLTDREFLEKLNKTGKPIIVSTGLSTDEEIDGALDILDNVEYILACTSTYPTATDELNLKYIRTLKKRYPNLKVGFSNHYNGLDACVGATALGAECIEFHVTVDRTMYGSDQPASIENADSLVDSVFKMELMLGDGVKNVYNSEKPIISKLRKVNNILN
tara:strand:+ start:208 stop:1035 length:828 start_codon:yes stop_codon:yes gene_type:complete